MEKALLCQEHGSPIQMLCITCNCFLCHKCLPFHDRKECKYPTDLTFYATDQLLPKYRVQVENFGKVKHLIDSSIRGYISSSKNLAEKLLELKKKLAKVIENIDVAVKAVSINIDLSDSLQDAVKLFLVNEYKNLEEAIVHEDMRYIISRISNKKLTKIIGVGDDELLLDEISSATSRLLEAKDCEALNKLLEQLVTSYQMFTPQSKPTIEGQYVYGICHQFANYKMLCRFDIKGKKLSRCVEVPEYSGVVQSGSRVFVCGGYNPVVNFLNEYTEETQSLALRAPMKYAKHQHRIESITGNSFVTVGGYNEVSSISRCEEYHIQKDRWTSLPDLSRVRYCAGTALVNGKYLYAIGGYDSGHEIERLDVMEKKEWKPVKVLSREIPINGTPVSFAVSDKEIMVLGGGGSNEAGVFNLITGIIKKVSYPLLNDYYNFNPVCIIRQKAYIIGDCNGHVNIFDMEGKKFEVIDFADASS
eukprot:TRINITY_DN2965_c0_g1_i1.p1 TRINITY_DN2965_c0_g1~~TRINITY_DN2965_c0_g1_i1.p1  ORF type:complete len:475 (+),score=120.69 TRINITY_DN2965_c0_g1_i1:111-1535(+)